VKALEKAKERRDRAAVALQDAEDELKAARERARETERTHKQARQELDRIK
jgi:F0F1-type ATP synthase membrane subunit b/b'